MGAATDLGATRTEAREAAQNYLNKRLNSRCRSDQDQSTGFTVPTINIASSFSSDVKDRKACAAQIRDACTSSGFFQITGHGISDQARQGILQAAKRFTKDLSREKKEALHVKHSEYFRGWEPAQYTKVNPDDWSAEDAAPETKEGFNWGYEEGLDPTGGDGAYRELDGSSKNGNVWPTEDDLPGFYAAVAAYYGEVLQLARHLFRLFALSLDLPETYFDSMTTHPGGIARLLYYPPPKDPQLLDPSHKDKEIGLGAHTDYECFTILLSSTTPGLEILSPENVWVPAPAVEGSLTINVADFLMRWTNGVYRSTVHRVVNRTREERYSVPFFFSINYEEEVETLPSCCSPELPSQYPPISAGEYILARLKATAKDE
ncbi:related to gibberellin 20-oxidase [Ramularia collo-cygni]|uniref:Related to gibberellin 20-oxidase n=1 Tax=Ramularia collo-cygni TaxID=112498 RepID=A0A2D3VCJ3_9PEZI|nr:related to gibberellin 20-oxidase [Ramularia collo-cygni]CZT24740.1 related to gibberellin 20-oxidase [Ramularia collo-cygni]